MERGSLSCSVRCVVCVRGNGDWGLGLLSVVQVQGAGEAACCCTLELAPRGSTRDSPCQLAAARRQDEASAPPQIGAASQSISAACPAAFVSIQRARWSSPFLVDVGIPAGGSMDTEDRGVPCCSCRCGRATHRRLRIKSKTTRAAAACPLAAHQLDSKPPSNQRQTLMLKSKAGLRAIAVKLKCALHLGLQPSTNPTTVPFLSSESARTHSRRTCLFVSVDRQRRRVGWD